MQVHNPLIQHCGGQPIRQNGNPEFSKAKNAGRKLSEKNWESKSQGRKHGTENSDFYMKIQNSAPEVIRKVFRAEFSA